jgi:hypothetical protein
VLEGLKDLYDKMCKATRKKQLVISDETYDILAQVPSAKYWLNLIKNKGLELQFETIRKLFLNVPSLLR